MRNNFEKLYEYEFNLRKIAEQECFRNKALADERLVLLKRYNKEKKVCMFCHTRWHTDDCELAEAIAEE